MKMLFLSLLFILLLSTLFILTPVSSESDTTIIIPMTASIIKKENGRIYGGWNPNRIEVKQGQKVILELKSLDTTHGFFLSYPGVTPQVIEAGIPVKVTFVASKKGIFYYYCDVECGPYHQLMVGQIRII